MHSLNEYQAVQEQASKIPLLDKDTLISSGDGVIPKKSFLSSLSEKFNGTVYDGTFTLLAATIGSGVVITPNALSYSGTIWSSIQMVYCCIITYYSLHTLVKCADTMKAKSYPELGFKTYGNWGKQAVNVCNFFGNWGTIIMYLQLTSQLCAVITKYFGGSNLPTWLIDPDSQIIPILQATVLILPLSLPREFKPLRYFVFVSFVCVLLCCFCIVYESLSYQPLSESFSTAATFTWSGFSTTFPTAVFAYSSQTNTIEVYSELKEPTMKKFKKMLNFTIVFVFLAYAVVGLIGYVPFANNISVLEDSDNANGIILEAYGYDLDGFARTYPSLVIISMITTCFTVIMTQPFNMRPCRECLRHIIRAIAGKFTKPVESVLEPEEEDDGQEKSNFKHFLYVFFPLYTAVTVVLYCESIQMVMNIMGSTFFSVVCFIIPSMFYLKIFKDNISTAQKIGQWFILISNAVFTVWNTYNNIVAAV